MSIKNLLLSLTIATTIMQPAIAKQEIAKPRTKKEMAIKAVKIFGYSLECAVASTFIGSHIKDDIRYFIIGRGGGGVIGTLVGKNSDTNQRGFAFCIITTFAHSSYGLYKELAIKKYIRLIAKKVLEKTETSK